MLVNRGPGVAHDVLVATHPLGNCKVRGASYAEVMEVDDRLLITVECSIEDLLYDMEVLVSWTDSGNIRHEQDDVELLESAHSTLIIR